MHEYAITKELLRISREKAKELKLKHITEIILDLGITSGYEKESVLYYFNELKLGGEFLKKAKLTINEKPNNEIKIKSISGENGS